MTDKTEKTASDDSRMSPSDMMFEQRLSDMTRIIFGECVSPEMCKIGSLMLLAGAAMRIADVLEKIRRDQQAIFEFTHRQAIEAKNAN